MDRTKKEQFIKEIRYLLGATLKGVKPAEILNLPYSAKKAEQGWGKWCERHLAGLRIVEIKTGINRKLVFFYHEKALKQTLARDVVLSFLRELNYPREFTTRKYVSHLCTKIQESAEFPHEVGIFLGYPLKDVLGYMGFVSLPCAGVKGWRYYGCYQSSRMVYDIYSAARDSFKLDDGFENYYSCGRMQNKEAVRINLKGEGLIAEKHITYTPDCNHLNTCF